MAKAVMPYLRLGANAVQGPVLPLTGKSVREDPDTLLEPRMSDLTLAEATANIYTSIRNDNEDLDSHIAALKAAMAREGATEATFETTKLAQPNRAGRKLLEAYFRRKGVAVSFT
jgi:hypothetical protein